MHIGETDTGTAAPLSTDTMPFETVPFVGSAEVLPAGWLDLGEAAAYAAVTPADLLRAIHRHEIDATTTHPGKVGSWMMRGTAVESWAAIRAELRASA
jgi:hypothetical protein